MSKSNKQNILIMTNLSHQKTELELKGIVLLQGEWTIEGQLIARKRALASCRSERAIKQHDSSQLNTWVKGHIQTIEKLEALQF